MKKIKFSFNSLGMSIALLSGTLYLTDKWKYLQPYMLLSGMIIIMSSLLAAKSKIRVNIRIFIIYSMFILSCSISALINQDIYLFVGALALYFMYISFVIAYPSNVISHRCEVNSLLANTFFYSHILLIIVPIIRKGLNRIPYSGIFHNPNSFGTIMVTFFAVVFSRFSVTIDDVIFYGKVKIKEILLNSIILFCIFILVLYSNSRSSFFTILNITITYFIISFLKLLKTRIKYTTVLRMILTILVFVFFSCIVFFTTRIGDLLYSTIINKIIRKSRDLLDGRGIIWKMVIDEVELFGNGRKYFSLLGKGAHSTFISLLGQYGILPTILYCIFLLSGIYYAYVYVWTNEKDRYRYLPLYSLLAFILLSITEGMFFKVSMVLTYCVIGGIVNKKTTYVNESKKNIMEVNK